MKLNVIVTVVFICIFAAHYYLYQQNKNLLSELERVDRACMLELSEVARKYQKQIKNVSIQLNNQPDVSGSSQVGIKSNLDKLVSHGHLIRAVNHKYEFLLQSAQLAEEEKKQLLQLLVEREKLSGVTLQSLVETDKITREKFSSRLAVAENSIKELLKDPVDYDRYEYLKNKSL